MFYVHLVLNEFYDGQDEVGVSEPAEHVVEDAEVFVLHATRDAVGEWCEHHTVYVGESRLYVARHGKGVVVGIARHTYHEVYVHGAQHTQRFLGGANLCKCRRIAQAKLHVLVIDFLFHTSVVFKHEGIVWICHYQHIVDAPHHEVDKRHVL